MRVHAYAIVPVLLLRACVSASLVTRRAHVVGDTGRGEEFFMPGVRGQMRSAKPDVSLFAMHHNEPKGSRAAPEMMAPPPDEPSPSRRDILAAAALGAVIPSAAWASGGATAGKYTTIPIAKRRYFGRVKQGVYEFILLGDAIAKGDLDGDDVTSFFAPTIKIQSKRQKKQCLGGGTDCEVKEKFSSRWEDMKLSMFLLGNAFRMDSGKPPEKVKQVKEANVFIKQVEKLQTAAQKGNQKSALLSFASARDALDAYLNDVDLPPSNNKEYQMEIDTQVPSLCQGSFCV